MNAPNKPEPRIPEADQQQPTWGLRHPLWLFLTAVLPQLVIGAYLYSSYTLIQSLLNKRSKAIWLDLAFIAFVGVAFPVATGLYAWYKKTPVKAIVAGLLLLGNIGILYAYLYYLTQLFPFTVPRWMLQADEMVSLPLGLMMPSLFYALLVIIDELTPDKEKTSAWINILYAIGVPVFWYLFFQILSPMLRQGSDIGRHSLPILFIAFTLVFFFFFLRGALLLFHKPSPHPIIKPVVRFCVLFVFPLLGLIVYNGHLFSKNWFVPKIVGSLQHPAFFLLALLTGIFLFQSPRPTSASSLFLFGLRSAVYPYTLYFFVIFLPFLPLSLPAIVLFGLGFLILAPTLLMCLHSYILAQDIRLLRTRYSISPIATSLVFLLSFSSIPGLIVLSMYQERATLHRALHYLYQPKGPEVKAPRIHLGHLQNSMDVLRSNVRRRRRSFINQDRNKVPFITNLYKKIVLDNMTLSQQKLDDLDQVFFKKRHTTVQRTVLRGLRSTDVTKAATRPTTRSTTVPQISRVPSAPYLSNVETTTRYDAAHKRYETTVTCMIQNDRKWQDEFRTSFQLPVGAWVKDYALWINGKKVPGALTEKKSTLWIYQQITSARRDPGLLYYEKDNTLTLRVFPIPSKGMRKTSFVLLHRNPFSLTLGHATYQLGKKHQNNDITTLWKDRLIYIPQAQKAKLPKIKRSPYFHFILDFSQSDISYADRYNDQIEYLRKRYGAAPFRKARVTIANYQAKTFRLNTKLQQAMKETPRQGGLFLDRVLKHIYLEHARKNSKTYPVIVLLSPNPSHAVMRERLQGLSFLSPDQDVFFSMTPEGDLTKHALYGAKPDIDLGKFSGKMSPFFHTKEVYAWPNLQSPRAYLPKDGQDGITLILPQDPKEKIVTSLPKESWEAGVAMHGLWLLGKLRLGGQDNWLTQIRWSWRTHLLSPQTSFTVLENEAQWEALRRKQKQVLAGKSFFDLTEDAPRRMDEPPLWLLFLLFAAFFWLTQRRRSSQNN